MTFMRRISLTVGKPAQASLVLPTLTTPLILFCL
jgi:hypothetical protein